MGHLTTPDALALRWTELIHDPALRDLPFKIELNAWGSIEMSPTSFHHSRIQGYVAGELGRQLSQGEVLIELAVLTDIGVRVPDVAWGSHAYVQTQKAATPATKAPEICVEVLSPSNSEIEIREKTRAYLAAGAEEVWIVTEDGESHVFDGHGERTVTKFEVRLDDLPVRFSAGDRGSSSKAPGTLAS
jgi:Uma2 family endonuclease